MAISAWSRNDSACAISLALNSPAVRLAKLSRPTHSPSRSIGRYSAAWMPNFSPTARSKSAARRPTSPAGAASAARRSRAKEVEPRVDRQAAGRPSSGPSGVAAATAEKVLPSRRMTKAESQTSSFTALATIASNTGRTSVGERLITRRISALAVWLASASLCR